jgi:uncharacterized protein
MKLMSALRIDVADLLTHPGARRPLHVEAAVADLGGSAARVQEPVVLDLVLERVPDGVVARGGLHAHWDAPCSTCLQDLGGDLDLNVAELYETHPVEGETYPIEAGHQIDLEHLVRDAVLLELPLAPTCRTVEGRECAPATTPGVSFDEPYDDEPVDAPADPRWAALSELDL